MVPPVNYHQPLQPLDDYNYNNCIVGVREIISLTLSLTITF